jgi:hypothetical protein
LGRLKIASIVLIVADIEATIQFCIGVLVFWGWKECFWENGIALKFLKQKINLHQKGNEIIPNAKYTICGSAVICFIVDRALGVVVEVVVKKSKHRRGDSTKNR